MRATERLAVLRTSRVAPIAALCVWLPTTAQAATADAQAQVTIVTPLSIVKTDDLRFGSIIPGPVAGTVNINAATGARTSSGPLVLVGNDYGRAHFIGLADRFRIVIVNVGAPPVLTRVGGGATMNVTSLQRESWLYFVPANNFVDVNIGGTLAVGANQAPGLYTGSFTVTMNYF